VRNRIYGAVAFTRRGHRLPITTSPRGHAVALLLAVLGTLSGCATGRTGTHVEPSPDDLSRIRKVGASVNVEHGFAVRLQYVSNADRLFIMDLIGGVGSGLHGSLQATGGVLGDATVFGTGVGAAAVVAGEFSPDKRATRALNSEAAKMKSADAIGRFLVDRLQAATVFPEVELLPSQPADAAPENDMDARFVVTVRKWGLRPPLGSKYGSGDKRLAQLELDVNLRLMSPGGERVLWERDEFYLDNECYSLGDFKSRAGLLVSRLELALQKVCDRTNNEIHRIR
jgi:hypothetical protein